MHGKEYVQTRRPSARAIFRTSTSGRKYWTVIDVERDLAGERSTLTGGVEYDTAAAAWKNAEGRIRTNNV